MALIYFITHPEVDVDPNIRVTDWDLSDIGIGKIEAMCKQPWIKNITSVYSSYEQKAITGAKMLAEKLNLEVNYLTSLGEVNRSATGYLPGDEFNAVVAQFFAQPLLSVRGWERAVDAQTRITQTLDFIVSSAPEGDIAVMSHGVVGGLLISHLQQAPIGTPTNQPTKGGNYCIIDRQSRVLLDFWEPIDRLYT